MTDSAENAGPLAGYRIVELAGIGPGPYCGQLFADMGAEVIVVDRPGPAMPSVDSRGKKSIIVDLRKPGGAEIVLKLVESADAMIEGYRPGVAERLGVGPEACHERNPKLVFGRMTGWGQEGPWSKMAGHDINYISMTGALNAMGAGGEPPAPPLNLVGDYGGGSLFLALGVVGALLKATKTGKGEVIDVAIIDGVSSMMGIIYSLHALGQWRPNREANLLDGGSPYYRCYKTADDKFMAVGCIEPQFFAEMLQKLDLSTDEYGGQNDFKEWPRQHQLLEKVFASQSRDHWAEIFDGSDACVTPVLDYLEATEHKHNAARASHKDVSGLIHPAPAPRFQGAPASAPTPLAQKGADTRAVLAAAGYSDSDIDALIETGDVSAS